MPVDERMRAQHQLILDNFGDGGDVSPPPTSGTISTISTTCTASTRSSPGARMPRGSPAALGDIFGDVGYGDPRGGADERQIRHEDLPGRHRPRDGAEHPGGGAGPCRSPGRGSRAGVARPEHKLYVCGYPCPRGRTGGGTAECRTRSPPPNLEGDDGAGVSVSIVDTGLMPNAAARPSLARRGAGRGGKSLHQRQ